MDKTDHQQTEETSDDFAVEISDLAPERRSHYRLLELLAFRTRLLAITQKYRVTRNRAPSVPSADATRRVSAGRISQAFAVAGLVLVLGTLLVGNIPPLRTRILGLFETPATTATPALANASYFTSASGFSLSQDHPANISPSSGSQQIIAPLPASCPKANSLRDFNAPLDPPGLGDGSVWLNGFSGPIAALVHVQQATRPGEGWYETVTLFIAQSTTTPITFDGASQQTEGPLAFSNPDSTDVTPSLTISPQAHFITDGRWKTTFMDIYVPTSGCYSLHATWQTGSWTLYFAAGS